MLALEIFVIIISPIIGVYDIIKERKLFLVKNKRQKIEWILRLVLLIVLIPLLIIILLENYHAEIETKEKFKNLETREIFKPINPDITNNIIKELIVLKEKYEGKTPKISMFYFAGRTRVIIKSEITQLLNKAGFGKIIYYELQNITSDNPSPAGVIFNPDDREFAKELSFALNPMFFSPLIVHEDKKYRAGIVYIYLDGEPYFDDSGRIYFKRFK